MNTEYHQAATDPSRASQHDLARQDIETLLANLNSFESVVKKSIARLREDILTTAVHLG